jgi:hypothetical protein
MRARLLAVLLAGAFSPWAAAQTPAPPSNTNSWQVIRPDGAERRVSANAAEVNAAGALIFVNRYGSTVFVVQAFAPGEWRCLRALGLRAERGDSFSQPPGAGC